MLANNTWLGGTGVFNVAANWSLGTVPVAADTIILNGASSNADLTIPGGVGIGYLGIQIQSNYTGTVEFAASVSFGAHHQAGGGVAQNTNTVTVTSEFMWTGGSINVLSAGTFHLKGVTAGRIGTDQTTLTCGARFILDKTGNVGTTLVQSGTLNLLADVTGFEVLNCGLLEQKPFNPAGPAPIMTIGAGGMPDRGVATTDGGVFRSFGGTVPSVQITNGGVLEVMAKGLTVTGKVPLSQWGVTMDGVTSMIILKNGETLKATNGILMNDGEFLTRYADDVLQYPKIDGLFRINDGKIRLGIEPAEGVTAFTTLLVTKDARLYGGSFVPKLAPTTSPTATRSKRRRNSTPGALSASIRRNGHRTPPPRYSFRRTGSPPKVWTRRTGTRKRTAWLARQTG